MALRSPCKIFAKDKAYYLGPINLSDLLEPSQASPSKRSFTPKMAWSQTVNVRLECLSWEGLTPLNTKECFHWGQACFFATGDFSFSLCWSGRVRQLQEGETLALPAGPAASPGGAGRRETKG